MILSDTTASLTVAQMPAAAVLEFGLYRRPECDTGNVSTKS